MRVNFKLSEDRNTAINELIDYHMANKLPRYKKLNAYYKGEHDIFKKQAPENTPNNKIATPYPKFIVDTATGYFLGQPVMYESDDEVLKSLLYAILDENEEDDVNMELSRALSITGEAFELVYIDEDANIQFAQLDNMQTIVHYDNKLKPNIDLALRYYEEDDVMYAELYTKDSIEYYVKGNNGFMLVEETSHAFGEVPVVHYLNNNIAQGDFEPALSLIDEYDRMLSNNSNEFEYFRNAYLILKGYGGTTDEEIADAVEKRAFKVDADGDITFLTKEINDTAVMNHLKTLHDNIHFSCSIPCLTDENFASNISGVALRYKLWGFENLIGTKERKFTQGLTRRLKLIIAIMNLKGHNFDYKDITLRYTRNLPQNLAENAEIVNKLSSVVPIEYLALLLPFLDREELLEKLAEEEQQADPYNENAPESAEESVEEQDEEKVK